MVNPWEGGIERGEGWGGRVRGGRGQGPWGGPLGTSDGPGDSPSCLSSPTQAGWGLSTRTLATHSGPACSPGAQGSAEVKGTRELAGQMRQVLMARWPPGVGGGTYVQVEYKDKRRKMTLESSEKQACWTMM